MTKGNAIRYYRKFSAAHKYIIGFIYNHKLYITIVNKIYPRWQTIKKEAGKDKYKLQMNLHADDKIYFLKRGAIEVCSEKEFLQLDGSNRGWKLETAVYNYFNQTNKGQDSEGFWKQGDICIDGLEYQIKFENAQMVTFDTIHSLQEMKENFRNYIPKRGKKA